MSLNSVIIVSVILVSVLCYYVFSQLILKSEQVPIKVYTSPELEINAGRVQGIFHHCSYHDQLLKNGQLIENKCQGGPKQIWNATACTNNQASLNKTINVLISTTLSSQGEFCGEKLASSLVCAITSNLIQNNFDAIKKFVTKEVFNDLSKKFDKNSIKRKFDIKNIDGNPGLCLSITFQIEELEQGEFIVKKLNFSNEFSKQQTIENQRKRLISTVIHKIDHKLQENKIKSQISWRIKSPGSIRMKMYIRKISMDQLNDIIGIRFIVNKEQECYQIIDIIHSLFDHDDFKDYIKSPKESGYQSLHTILIGDKSELGTKFHTRIEVQVRTFKMDWVAEFGRAAHSQYKKNQSEEVHHHHHQAQIR